VTDDQHAEGTPRSPGRWDPLPQGDYDDGATAFVKLPEGGVDALLASADSPLAAPGHGYVPPQITVNPATAAGTDPAATGSWNTPAAPAEGARWPEPNAVPHGTGDDRFTYTPGATGQWNFDDTGAAEAARTAPAPGHDVTGQWSIPVAGGDLPDESGEFTTSSLVEQWGATPPATLPGGAPAPWATEAVGQPWGQPSPTGPEAGHDTGQHPEYGQPASAYVRPAGAEYTQGHSAGDGSGYEQTAYDQQPTADGQGHRHEHGQGHGYEHEQGHGYGQGHGHEHEQAAQAWHGQEQPAASDGPHGMPDGPQGTAHDGPHGAPEAPEAHGGAQHAVPTEERLGAETRTPEGYGDRQQAPEAHEAEPQPADPHAVDPHAPEAYAQEQHAHEPHMPEAHAPEGHAPEEPGQAGEAEQLPAEAHSDTETSAEAGGGAVEDASQPAHGPGEAVEAAEAAQGAAEAVEAAEKAAGAAAEPAGHAADAADAEPRPESGSQAADEPAAPEAAEAAPPPSGEEHPLASYVLRVNGVERPVTDAWIGESLLYVLRERLGLAGAKDGCSQGECGACNVQVDGRLVASCLVPAVTAAGSEVRTVEGLAEDGQPSDVQRALARCGAVQCGFCVPGMAMTVHDLLEGNPAPTELETRQALCGNLCRCSGYRGVVEAVKEVVAEREAHSAADAETDADEPRIPHQAGPGAGGVHPSAFAPAEPHDQAYRPGPGHGNGQGEDGGQA
jgi:aerobic-type carbon monoxide dehydrogenase small subunit (CoxS/CutS family)